MIDPNLILSEDGKTLEGVKNIYKCIDQIAIPIGTEIIRYNAFRDCSSINNVVIPNTVVTIEGGAFANCTSLKSLFILNPDGPQLKGLYLRIKSLDSHLPNSVSKIGRYAFGNCCSLQSLIIPDSVIEIGSSAFWGCSSMTTIENQIPYQ